MTDLARLNSHTSALLDVLNTAKVKTFDAGAPDLDVTPGVVGGWGWQGTPNQSRFLPYRALYPIIGGIFDGTLGEPSDDASLIYQVTCVGRDRPQCEAIVDDTNDLLVEQGSALVVPGRFIMRVWSDMAGGGARRDDTVQPPVFIATPRYRVESTPIAGGS
jgi:hypothetical protein